MRAVSALLGKGLSPWAPTWALVVGAPTARSSVCLGPNDEGILRVMTRTRSDCDELLAREPDILAAWNEWATQKGQAGVRGFSCWVYDGLVDSESKPSGSTTIPLEARWIEAAEADIPPTEHGEVRDSLVRARARLLRRRDRDSAAQRQATEDASND